MKTIHHHPVLGELTINRSTRARRISVSVRASGVSVTVPPRCPVRDALAFAESKRAWIEQAKERIGKRTKPQQAIVPPFRTRLHELAVEPGMTAGFSIRGGKIAVLLPEEMILESDDAQRIIRTAVTEAFRIEAKRLLPERVRGLADRHGFLYTGLSFRNTVSRWGSCSGRNSISLSVNLMSLPDRLIDYVILHELCHTREKNHGADFHALLDRVTEGRHRELERELKQHSIRGW